MYPRLNTDGKLVAEDQMVGIVEHMNQKYRMAIFHGEIAWETKSCDVMLAMDSVSNDPIKIMLTSPGGAVDAAFLMYDTIKTLRSPVYVLGRYCASAAVVLLAAGQKGKRYLLPHSKVMMHLITGGAQGDLKQIETQSKQIKEYQQQMVEILRECGVKKKASEVMKDIDRDFWLNPQEAIEYGLADKIMDATTLREWLAEKPFCTVIKSYTDEELANMSKPSPAGMAVAPVRVTIPARNPKKQKA